MPWQLIYTSAPRGLLSGQSGFCTVARSGDLREALVQRLEQISSYHYLRVAEAATANRNPTVCAFRILDLRGSKYYVLTRIQPCGLDFTARTNHIAHHLIFQPNELAQLPSPAAILRNWNGWLSAWQGEPRIVEDPSLDSFDAAKFFLPAQNWLRVTGDAGRAAGLLEGECVRGCYLVCPPGGEQQVLEMFCETLQLLNLNGQFPLRPWRHPFTTFLQAEENPADFQWRACQEGTPAHQQALQRGSALLPLGSVRVPGNSLVKVAREGQKVAAPPPAAATPAKTKLTLQQPAGRRPTAADNIDPSQWQKPAARREKPALLDINFSLNWAAIARIGVVVAILSGLFVMKGCQSKEHAPSNSTVQTAPIPAIAQTPVATPRYPAHAAELDILAEDGPTYVFTTGDLADFKLPMDSISRFQNLIQRFDHLDTLPADINLSFNTNEWDFSSGARLIVKGMEAHKLSAQSESGLECSFDYSSWQNDAHNPVEVHAAFSTPPAAFSVHFGFPSGKGDPFRLLIVNYSNPPAPLHLSLPWLAGNQALLRQRLSGGFTLSAGWRWQLQPFIKINGKGQTNYLYKDWAPEDLPPFGDELDFAEAKSRLNGRLKPLNEKADGLAQKLAQQTKSAALDTPLGKDLGLDNEKLASLSAFAAKPAPEDFILYLNAVKKQVKFKWPRVSGDDDATELETKFQRLYDSCIDKNPEMKPQLTIGNTNYFSAVWQNLKDIDKLRQEKQRVQDDIDKFEERQRSVPDTLDKAAYVGLFMIDPPKPGLEMIRFEGP